jgi:protein-S-isoprenylcysteine O-methyltransferase Ste14
MASPTIWQIEMIPWYAFAVAWFVVGLRSRPDKVTEPVAARVLLLVYTATAFSLLFSHWLPFPFLYRRLLPLNQQVTLIGIIVTYFGAALAIWARVTLGNNWSAHVNLKFGHQLVRSGAYAKVRHPIYSGVLLAVIGTALVVGEWRGLVAGLLFAVTHGLKARREEQFMMAEFGDRYAAYRRQTGFLVPTIR